MSCLERLQDFYISCRHDLAIQDSTFNGCSKLTSLYIPKLDHIHRDSGIRIVLASR